MCPVWGNLEDLNNSNGTTRNDIEWLLAFSWFSLHWSSNGHCAGAASKPEAAGLLSWPVDVTTQRPLSCCSFYLNALPFLWQLGRYILHPSLQLEKITTSQIFFSDALQLSPNLDEMCTLSPSSEPYSPSDLNVYHMLYESCLTCLLCMLWWNRALVFSDDLVH